MGPPDSFVVLKFISLQNGKNKSHMIYIQIICWPKDLKTEKTNKILES